jgi:hypothetical protein
MGFPRMSDRGLPGNLDDSARAGMNPMIFSILNFQADIFTEAALEWKYFTGPFELPLS